MYESSTASQDTTGADNVVVVTALGANQCTEVWYLSDSALACVELQGTLKRERNTGDVEDDIILEYTSYNMHALIGRTTDTESNADQGLRLAEQVVDFSVLILQGASYGATVAGGILAGVLALNF